MSALMYLRKHGLLKYRTRKAQRKRDALHKALAEEIKQPWWTK